LLIADDGFGMPLHATATRQRIRELAAALVTAGGAVVEITTKHPDARRYHPAGDRGAHRSVLDDDTARTQISSAGVDGFFGSDLDATLRRLGREQLLMTGHFLETAVHSTLRSANDRGYECLTVSDACLSADAQTAGGALSSIQMSGGIFGAVGLSTAVIVALTNLIATSPIEELA
jgi:nicotinamidase-related amidase